VYETGFRAASAGHTVNVRDGSTIVGDGVADPDDAVVAGMCVVDVPDITG
jgi:hypothetical protein